MSKISNKMFKEFIGEGFFDDSKNNEEVIKKLGSRGFSIKGKKKGMISRMLTLLCQEGVLEREKDTERNWRYKKR